MIRRDSVADWAASMARLDAVDRLHLRHRRYPVFSSSPDAQVFTERTRYNPHAST